MCSLWDLDKIRISSRYMKKLQISIFWKISLTRALIHCRGISYSKRQDQVLIMTRSSFENYFLLIAPHKSGQVEKHCKDLKIGAPWSNSKAEDKWLGVAILNCDVIQQSIVNVRSQRAEEERYWWSGQLNETDVLGRCPLQERRAGKCVLLPLTKSSFSRQVTKATLAMSELKVCGCRANSNKQLDKKKTCRSLDPPHSVLVFSLQTGHHFTRC